MQVDKFDPGQYTVWLKIIRFRTGTEYKS